MDIDFKEFEKHLYEKYKSSLSQSDELIEAIGLIAAKVSTIAIQEYHQLLEKNESDLK